MRLFRSGKKLAPAMHCFFHLKWYDVVQIKQRGFSFLLKETALLLYFLQFDLRLFQISNKEVFLR